MFIDLVNVKIKSGKGGDGMVSFRREKYVAKGGPSGGTGGKGGSIIFIGEEGLTTLLDLRFNKVLKADPGENGMTKNKNGKDALNRYVKVPLGSTIIDTDTNIVIGDVTKHKQTIIAARGGRGGRGNADFATSRNTAPEISERGEPGISVNIKIELKVLADVGLVGFPSVGKSTLISVVSAARPKIADYHFTTITPNLGVVQASDKRSFVMADLPGLIEGASQGVGLGLQFLRHIERTRVILHILDMSGMEGRDPYEDYIKINKELESYKYNLLKRPMIIVANKMDLPNAQENLIEFKSKLEDDIEIYQISNITKEGIDLLLLKVADKLDITKEFKGDEDEILDEEVVEYNFVKEEVEFTIDLIDNIYCVEGKRLKKLFEMTDFTKDQSVMKFARTIRTMGIDEALRKKGVQNGDIVKIFEFEFEFLD